MIGQGFTTSGHAGLSFHCTAMRCFHQWAEQLSRRRFFFFDYNFMCSSRCFVCIIIILSFFFQDLCSHFAAHPDFVFQSFCSYFAVFSYSIYQACSISTEYAPQTQVEYIQQAPATSSDTPECGLLHEKLSLMWGDYQDKVDELTMEMNKSAYLIERLEITCLGWQAMHS